MVFFLSKFLPALFFPLSMACLLILVSLIAQFRNRRRIAIVANIVALAILCVMGNRTVSHLIMSPLESHDMPPEPLPPADAIVVLGGVTAPAIPPQPVVHLTSGADRLTYGAQLYRDHKAQLVILSGGGMPWNEGMPPESTQMAEVMQMLGVPRSAILEESSSRNSHENAAYTSRLLLAHNLHRVLLVTSAIAMPRALAVFRKQGIDAIAAPTDFTTDHGRPNGTLGLEVAALGLVPSSRALEESSGALHEYLGLLIYRLVGWT
jgi:uncharacterized SAM-binding protein YcdF (DUF218 family)